MQPYDEPERSMRQTAEFREHVARLLAPLKPGLAYVRTLGYAVNDFEHNYGDPDFMDVLNASPATLLQRARTDAIRCVDYLEREFVEQIESDAIAYMKQPDKYGGQNFTWNATNPEDLATNLSCFCDINIGIWEDLHFPTYRQSIDSDPTLAPAEREAVAEYVRSFVGSASATVPYHLEEGSEEIYYDSDDTEKADD